MAEEERVCFLSKSFPKIGLNKTSIQERAKRTLEELFNIFEEIKTTPLGTKRILESPASFPHQKDFKISSDLPTLLIR